MTLKPSKPKRKITKTKKTTFLRKRAESILAKLEKALEESSATTTHLNSIINAVADPIFVKDRQHRWVLLNNAYCRLKGLSRDELLGKTVYDIDPKNEADVMWQDDEFVFNTGQEHVREGERTDSEGIVNITVTKKTLFKNKKGEDFIVGVVRDITERKLAEEMLRERNAWINSILEASPAAIYSLDKEGIVLSWNRAAEQMYGWSKEEAIGILLPIIPEEKLEEFRVNINKILRGEPFLGVELTRRKKGGSNIDISLSAAPLYDSSGAAKGIMALASDMTRQKKMEAEHAALENQLRQAQKMEAVGQLAGGIAHDFNNILSAIIGYGYVSLMKMAADDPQRLNIEQILIAADRAAYLTKDLLLFSRKQVSDRKAVDLNEIVMTMEKFLKRVIREDVAFEMNLHKGIIPVLADMHQLEQVFMNLATNARDAMPQGGTFTIATELIMLGHEFITAHGYGNSGIYALLTVADTGTGMDEQTRRRIFEPFFTTKEVGKGTGLGMAVVYGIIKQHDGYINAYSEPGKGTTIKIYLPLIASGAIQEKKTKEVETSERGTETILLAEDDELLRNLTKSVLEDFGYTVIVAVDGEEAVKKYTENKGKIQLLLFDLIMPKKTGKEAYDEIKNITPDIKGIFLTGYAADIIQEKGLLQDTVLILRKPISPMDLLKKVRRALGDGKSSF
jgi:two-component system, cell cycle sensor histidine kinase and response regulator CckA